MPEDLEPVTEMGLRKREVKEVEKEEKVKSIALQDLSEEDF